MRKLVLFNGPPRSGKDTAASHLFTRTSCHWFRMSQPLKDGIRSAFAMTEQEYHSVEDNKDKKSDLLFGRSFREVQISMAEDWMKQYYGQRVFGHLAARRAARSISRLMVCSDTGFDYELPPLVDVFGVRNVLLVRIHRKGCNFAVDSRSYIEYPYMHVVDIANDGTKENFCSMLDVLVDAWIAKRDEEGT